MASSSQIACASPPSSDPCWKYDVFLSFRGVDTRKGITVDIHDRLNRSGIKTFMDEQDLQVGDVISPTFIAAIKESRFAIVVLSQNYASSAWCLEELREICLSMEDNRILPLFYHVDPTNVRYQKESFEKDFSKHETSGRHESEKVKQWKAALNKVACFSGWNTNDYKTHKELVDVIAEFLRSKVVPDAIESTGDFEAFEATRQAMNEIMKALKDDEVTAVGVYGMGGVGKTTMVKHVGAHARKSGIFDCVIMGVVSQSPDYRKIQGTLADLLGVKLEGETEIGRAAGLSKEMKRRNKILIILDDIWGRTELSKIGIPSYEELHKCKSKVLLTTRIWNVCHVMRCQRKIILSTLSEKDSWTLFVRNAESRFESTTFKLVAKKVAGECRGLPIALIAVARALGDKEPEEWKRAAQRLEKSQIANPDDKGDAFECIKLSFDYLKDEDHKSFFLLCCLFPEDREINIEDLFRYAIGKGLFQDAETMDEARGTADSVVKYLKDSSLLLESEYIGFVKMHDVVRDTAIQIAQFEHGFLVRAGCGLKDWPRQLHEGYSAVSLMHNHITKLPEKFVCPELQILLLNNNTFIDAWIHMDIPETFFQTPNELRVLDLSQTITSLLPQSLCLLTNLRTLYLDGCSCSDTSMIGKLKKLEILSMRHGYLKKLSREIGDLTNLKILDFTGTSFRTILSEGIISKLHNLEELYMRRFSNWGRKVEGDREETNVGFDEVTSLSNLRVLEVRFSDAACTPKNVELNPNWVKFKVYMGRGKKMEFNNRYGHKSIFLRFGTPSSLPDWFCNGVMNITERLRWEGCRRLIDIFVESEHGRLHGLKLLYIFGSRGYKLMNPITWVPKKPVFENLEELHLENVNCQELCVGELPPGSLFNLKLLKVHSCNNWGNVFLPSTLLQRLPNLEELHCLYLEIEYVFGYEALFEPEQSHLRKIDLYFLGTITSICDGPALPAMFQNLQSLSISWCGLLGSLFTSDVAQYLFQLEYIGLLGCPFLQRIVEASNKKIILPKLKELVLKELPMLYYESASFDIECPSLENLYVTDCPMFLATSLDFHSRKQVQFKRLKNVGLFPVYTDISDR